MVHMHGSYILLACGRAILVCRIIGDSSWAGRSIARASPESTIGLGDKQRHPPARGERYPEAAASPVLAMQTRRRREASRQNSPRPR